MRTRAAATTDLDAGQVAAAVVSTDTLATVDEHLPGAFGFRIKATASEALFLVLPQRDPSQPRFWCVVVVKCAPGGLVDASELGWMGKQGLRREELAETMAAIRENLDSWLAEPAQARLRTWILTAHPAARDDGIGTEVLTGLQEKLPSRHGLGPRELRAGSDHIGAAGELRQPRTRGRAHRTR